MDTFFASAGRAKPQELNLQIEIVANNPVVDGILYSVTGLLAVLNANRQIVSLNDSFLRLLGIDDPAGILGLRVGEAVRCPHAQKGPDGCGTSRHCASCGAAIAMVASLGQSEPVERTCALTTEQDGVPTDLALLVRSTPIRIQRQDYLLLFLTDISQERRRANLERSFFHDMSNILTVLSGNCELLEDGGNDREVVRQITKATARLVREFEIQKGLLLGDGFEFPVRTQETDIGRLLDELEAQFALHPAARSRTIEFPARYPAALIRTDDSLCLRILTNMVVNALEATDEDGRVEIWLEESPRSITFCVWNEQVINDKNALRIFQRNFSTKPGLARGFGTYSMKLFGEKILGGRVSFRSPENNGTVFRLELPV